MSARTPSPRSSERGSATVTALATIAASLVVLLGLMLVAGVASARGQAQSAADLAALAAARALHRGDAAPCGAAGHVVSRNGASLVRCTSDGWDVVVEAGVPVEWVGRASGFTARASARAGPTMGGDAWGGT